MHALIRDTLAYIQQQFATSDKIIVSEHEALFFQEIAPSLKEKLVEIVPFSRNTPKPSVPIVQRKQVEPVTYPEPSPKSPADPMNDLRTLVAASVPNFRFKEQVPSDAAAKKIATFWQEELHTAQVALLMFGQTDAELQFLQNVTKAIDSLLAPAKLIDALRFEKENKWDLLLQPTKLKCIVAPPFALWKESKLGILYRENPAAGSYTLQNIPLVLLQPIQLYLKNPDLKKGLWTSLVSQLSS